MKQELEAFELFIKNNKRKSMTILEIGCGPVQPLARELARTKFLNDKYRVDLISINPLKERSGQYEWEKE
jgi:hypothetical protein